MKKTSKALLKKKSFALLTALALVMGCAIGGTLAWLTDSTEEVKNTFTTSNIEIDLDETTGDTYTMKPGWTIEKDPKVTVEAGSEACYLFVKLEKSLNFDNFMTFEMAEGWTELTGVEGVTDVYYRTVATNAAAQNFPVLKDNQVLVKADVTAEKMEELNSETYPTLTITAYASQQYKDNAVRFTAAEAWGIVQEAATE